MATLSVRHLSKSFGNTRVIDNISIDVQDGEFCILLGPSGCGKTTVLRLIAGLEQQDSGGIYIDDKEISDLSPKDRNIAMVFQSYALYPHKNVYENMAFPLKMNKIPKQDIEEKVLKTSKLLGLDEFLKRKPKELSGGQRQRVAIGRAIVREPQLFLFDEPLSNLDAKLRGSMRVELARLHQKLKATILYVTHDQIEAMTLGSRIILFDKGKIQQAGSPSELYHKPANLFVASFVGSPQINLVQGSVRFHGKEAAFTAGNFKVTIGNPSALSDYADKPVVLGIRPEALAPGDGPIRGELEFIERLGPETILYADVDGTRIIAKAPSGYEGHRGKKISLQINERGIHFFHNENRIDF
jgi:ABC-type sugar transport system ATPase subunit